MLRKFIIGSLQTLFVLGVLYYMITGMFNYAIPYLKAYYAERQNHTHQYKVLNADMYYVGYTNDLTIDEDGCMLTSEGKACGSFTTKVNTCCALMIFQWHFATTSLSCQFRSTRR